MYWIYHQGRLYRIYDIDYAYTSSIFDSVMQWRHSSKYHYRGIKSLLKLIKNQVFIGTIYEYKYLPVWISNSFDFIQFYPHDDDDDGLVSYPRYSDVSGFLDKMICHVINKH